MDEIKLHREFRIGRCQSVGFYLYLRFSACCSFKKFGSAKFQKLRKIYEFGEERLTTELSVETIIKNLRDVRINLKNTSDQV